MVHFRINIYLSILNFLKSFFISNPEIKKIEKLINKTSGKRGFVLTSQLRVGFLILLKYLKKKFPKKKEIIFQPFNLPEMINVAKNLDLKTNFVEQSLETGEPNLQSLKKKLNKKTLAVVVTNIFNSPSSLLNIKKICSKRKIILIEDNAIYFDNYFYKKNKKYFSGSFGDYSLYSFNIMKNISGFFGGGVSTNDTKFIKFANEEISNYKNFNKSLLSKQILIFLILKILKFGIFYKIFIKVLRQAHQKNNLSVLKIVYPSLKFKRISFPSYYFSKFLKYLKK